MKKLLIAAAVAAAAVAPVAAMAADPAPADFKNAAKFCKAFKAASGSNFASMFGTKKNAYGKCVSKTAKSNANEDATQEKTAKTNAAKECKAERGDAAFADSHGGKSFAEFYGTNKNGKNAYGKCVSTKAKAKKAAADKEDKAQAANRVSAAKSCKQAKKDDADKFAEDFGTRRNAFGKCVSKTAKQLAAERKAEEQAAPTA
jgi:hypothetical protein